MEYRQLMRQSNRYPGRPTVLSPQLQDFNILEHVRHAIACKKADFLLVLDVSFVEEDELELSFPEPHLLRVDLLHACRNAGDLRFMRDCIYFYELPSEVDRKNLVGLWTVDNFLVIKNKSPENTVDPENVQNESVVKDIESKQEPAAVAPKGKAKVGRKTKGKAEDSKEKTSSKNVVSKGKVDSKNETVPKSSDGKENPGDSTDDNVPEPVNKENHPLLIPIRSKKVFKPVLSVVELKRLMSDIEDRMLCARRFIENSSFATPHEQIEPLETETEEETSTKDIVAPPKSDSEKPPKSDSEKPPKSDSEKKKSSKKKQSEKKEGFEATVKGAPILEVN